METIIRIVFGDADYVIALRRSERKMEGRKE